MGVSEAKYIPSGTNSIPQQPQKPNFQMPDIAHTFDKKSKSITSAVFNWGNGTVALWGKSHKSKDGHQPTKSIGNYAKSIFAGKTSAEISKMMPNASFVDIDGDGKADGYKDGFEALKALGILVDDNTIKQVAYSEGIASVGSELTQQQKVLLQE